MNFLFTINENYVEPIKTLLYSIYENVEGEKNFYFIYEDISQVSINDLSNFIIRKCQANPYFIHFQSEEFIENLPLEGGWSKEIYFRLFAPYLLNSVERILYLDGDTIVTGDLVELNNIEKDNRYVIAGVANDIQMENLIRLGLKERDTYINSGVLLMNLSKWREDCSLEELKRLLYSLKEQLVFPDQDFINILWKNRIRVLPKDYNYLISLTERNPLYQTLANPQICHYVFTKPWESYFEYKTDGPFLKYLWRRGEKKKSIRLFIQHRSIRLKSKLKDFLEK